MLKVSLDFYSSQASHQCWLNFKVFEKYFFINKFCEVPKHNIKLALELIKYFSTHYPWHCQFCFHCYGNLEKRFPFCHEYINIIINVNFNFIHIAHFMTCKLNVIKDENKKKLDKEIQGNTHSVLSYSQVVEQANLLIRQLVVRSPSASAALCAKYPRCLEPLKCLHLMA